MRFLVIANWKMNLSLKSAINLSGMLNETPLPNNIDLIIAPSFLHITEVANQLPNIGNIMIAGQDCAGFSEGSHTGDTSANMLAELGCKYVIIGHSERRSAYNESAELLAAKLDMAYENGLIPIFCIGEDRINRENNNVLNFLMQQLEEVGLDRLKQVGAVIAYEPVWSIGSGILPTKGQIEEVSCYLKTILDNPIVYGGSVNGNNSAELSSISNIAGLLIGKASAENNSFLKIIKNIN
jgi:triosephosphate isomerase